MILEYPDTSKLSLTAALQDLDGEKRTPCDIATELGHLELARMLQPSVSAVGMYASMTFSTCSPLE